MNRLALAALLVVTGCAVPRAYVAKTDRVEALGAPASQDALRSVLQRASVPKIGTVEISPAYLRYQHTPLGLLSTPQATTWTHLTWSHIDRVDVYVNNRAFVYESGAEKASLQFATPADAEEFADLVMSFKRWGSSPPK